MHSFFYRQLKLLTIDEFYQLFLRKRALFGLIIYASFLILSFYTIAKIKPYNERFASVLVSEMGISAEEEVLYREAWQDFDFQGAAQEKYPQYPVLSYPWPLALYFFISLSTLPFLITFVSCDMISKDLSNGTHQFLLFRVSRLCYFTSKTLAHGLLYLLLQAGLFAIFLLLGRYLFHLPSHAFTLQWVLDIHLRLVPLVLVFLTFTQVFSCLCNSVMKSLFAVHFAMLGELILCFIYPSFSIWNPKLWQGLLLNTGGALTQSVLGFLAWAAFFWLVGYGLFEKKKLA